MEIISRLVLLHCQCHHQNDSCIKMGGDESHFNVSLTVRDKVTRRCSQTTAFEQKEELKWIRRPPSAAYQPNTLLLGQTGSHHSDVPRQLYLYTSFIL